MKKLEITEKRRIAIQREQDSKKTKSERNRLGQFATPTELATDILSFAETLIPNDDKIRFLDPAIGTGSFYSALLRVFPSSRISKAQGYEIDAHYGDPAIELWRDHNLRIDITDFTKLEPVSEKFNLLICNPPYVRHHHLTGEEKKRLGELAKRISGHKTNGLTGLYVYFLLMSHQWLSEDGIAGWLIPSEFMDVNYGNALKKYLLTEVELLRVHRFNPLELQFDDALVTSSVVWFRKRKPKGNHTAEFTYGGSLLKPKASKKMPISALNPDKKWSNLDASSDNSDARIGDLFTIKRGLATGDNNFFILSKAEIQQRKLPMKFFRPILPAPRHLVTDEVDAEKDGVPKLDKQLFLLDCPLPSSEIKKKYPKLWKYLASGEDDVAKGYICSHRSPWYSQESRPYAPIVCTYMGRTEERPFRFILNKSKATAPNTYLMLYPKGVLAEKNPKPEALRSIWKYLNEISGTTLLRQGRVYGGGLYKMEPKELANVPANDILKFL